MRFIYRPELFAAAGAGFTERTSSGSQERVYPGVHLRFFSDPDMGRHFRAKAAYRIYTMDKGISIANMRNLAYWKQHPANLYPIRSISIKNLFHADNRNHPSGRMVALLESVVSLNSLSFVFEKRNSVLFGDANAKAIRFESLDPKVNQYSRGVFKKLFHTDIANSYQWSPNEVVGVDFNLPEINQDTTTTEEANQQLLKEEVDITIRGFDAQGRLVSEDWLGARKAENTNVLNNDQSLTTAKETTSEYIFRRSASLRSAGMIRVEISGKGISQLFLGNVYWVFTDEYLENRDIRPKKTVLTEPAMFWSETFEELESPLVYSSGREADSLYAPFRIGRTGYNDFLNGMMGANGLYHQTGLLQNARSESTYAMRHLKTENPDEAPPPEEGMAEPNLLDLMNLAETDPLVARFIGTYYFKPAAEIQDFEKPQHMHRGDYKILWIDRTFFQKRNLDTLGVKHQPGSASDGSQPELYTNSLMFSGLVLATEGYINKPTGLIAPPLELSTTHNPSGKDKLMVSANIELGSNSMLHFHSSELPHAAFDYIRELYSILRPIGYSATRFLSVDNGTYERENIGAFTNLRSTGALPPLIIPRDNGENFIIKDFFERRVKSLARFKYYLRAYDMFARPGRNSYSEEAALEPPIYPPPAPQPVSAFADEVSDGVHLTVNFGSPPKTEDFFETPATGVEIFMYREALGGTQTQPNYNTIFQGEETRTDLEGAVTSWQIVGFQWDTENNNLEIKTTNFNPAAGTFPEDPSIEKGDIYTGEYNNDGTALTRTGFTVRRLLASTESLGEGLHVYHLRLRSFGESRSGQLLYSNPVYTAAKIRLLPEPPLPRQPEQQQVPRSTYPDGQSRSYYYVDLNEFVNRGEHVNLYLRRVDAEVFRTPNWEGEVTENLILQETASVALKERVLYEKVNEKPIKYDENRRHYRVNVQGDLEGYFLVVVTGVEPSFRKESAWENSAALVFTNPRPMNLPKLSLLESGSVRVDGAPKNRIYFEANFVETQTNPPRIQVLRQDESAGERAQVMGSFIGTELEDKPGTYSFEVLDQEPLAFRHYRYNSTLMAYSEGQNTYMRGESKDVFLTTEAPPDWTIAERPGFSRQGAQRIFSFRLPIGDFQLYFRWLVDGAETHRNQAQIQKGALEWKGSSEAVGDLTRDNDDFILTVKYNGAAEEKDVRCLASMSTGELYRPLYGKEI